MPTQTPLTDQINALTTYANTITGQSDTCLSDAVATLVDGYGGGGSTPTGFIGETVITASERVTGTNNLLTVLQTLIPALSDVDNRHFYLLFLLNNTETNKAGKFAWIVRYNTGSNNFYYGACRAAGSTLTWISNSSNDFWYSAGTEIHILEFNSLIGMN